LAVKLILRALISSSSIGPPFTLVSVDVSAMPLVALGGSDFTQELIW
jgi:hypothetical protein